MRALLGGWLVCFGCVAAGASLARAAPALRAGAELGPGLDTNAKRRHSGQRSSIATQEATPLLRFVGWMALSSELGRRQTLSLRYGGGAKYYFAELGRPANELIQVADVAWWLVVGRGRALGLTVDYYDAFLPSQTECPAFLVDCSPPRDFRSGGMMLRLALLGQGATSGQLGIGYRGFQFKSDGAFSFSAAAVEGVISRRIAKGSDSGAGAWRLSASYRFEARRFASPVQLAVGCAADPGICGVTPGASDRYDAFQQLQLSARYLGAAQAELSYGFVANSSGSYGEDYQRHACSLGFTAPLWGPLFLSATAVLQLSRFSDSALTAPGLAIEGDPEAENRSRVTIHLAWELSARWSLGLRYAIYLNESGSAAGEQPRPSFLRQTIFMGLRFDYASES